MSTAFLFTLFYSLISGCIIYPPNEFISAGLTVEGVFSRFLGSEHANFIEYHLKKTIFTAVVHCVLPLGYAFGLLMSYDEPDSEMVYAYHAFVALTILVSSVIFFIFNYWEQENFSYHPICRNLKRFCNNDSSWLLVADSINAEFLRIDKMCIKLNSIHKLIVTDNWILKVTPYTIHCAHQSDTELVVIKSDYHGISQHTHGTVQFINIEVRSSRAGVPPFTIRLNALDFKDLQDKVSRPIAVLPTVTFHKTLVERFIDAFKQQVNLNPRYRTTQDLETCIGCMQALPNVKLQKNCLDVPTASLTNKCTTCHCRPMWCIDCMAKWFVSRQDEAQHNRWLSAKCTCPLCRSKFCVLDVSLLET